MSNCNFPLCQQRFSVCLEAHRISLWWSTESKHAIFNFGKMFYLFQFEVDQNFPKICFVLCFVLILKGSVLKEKIVIEYWVTICVKKVPGQTLWIELNTFYLWLWLDPMCVHFVHQFQPNYLHVCQTICWLFDYLLNYLL